MAGKKLKAEHEDLRRLLMKIAKVLVDAEADVRVEVVEEPERTILWIHVAAADVGKVIGKKGRTVRSIRTIIAGVNMKYQRQYVVDIVDGKHGPAPPIRRTAMKRKEV